MSRPAILVPLCFPLGMLACEAAQEEPSVDPALSDGGASVPSSQDLVTKPSSFAPRPDRRRGESAVQRNDDCVLCHTDQADQWEHSRHAQAFTNDAFQAAYAIEPQPFCRGCHAPELGPDDDANNASAEIGVACVTCHLDDTGAIVTARAGNSKAPHPVRYDDDFAHTAACANCHEFPFPGAHGEDDALFMQTTVREHAVSPAADESCASCHMQDAVGQLTHGFDVRDPRWLADHIDVIASVAPSGQTSIRLTPRQRGHAFPTGDLYRRLEVGAALVDEQGHVQREQRHQLARHWGPSANGGVRQLIVDNRLHHQPVDIELDILCAEREPAEREPAERIVWWVELQRVAEIDERDHTNVVIESAVRLHEGTLCAHNGATP